MLSREIFRDIESMLRPIRTRADNMIARGVVSLVNATVKMQILQVGIQDAEPVDEVEHFQPYGFKSVPLPGSESVVLFIGGDRGAPVAVVTDDRRTRPTDWAAGEVGIYHKDGASVRLKEGGDIEVDPGPGGLVYVRQDGGASEPLVRKSEFDAHLHPTGVGPSGAPSVPAVGSEVLRG